MAATLITLSVSGVLAGQKVLKPSDHSGPLQISATTDKKVYAADETINLTVTLKNTGAEPIAIVHPEYWGVSELFIVDEKGNAVEPHSFKSERKAFKNLMTIPAGGHATHTFEKLTSYTCCYAYSFHGLLPPGRLAITVQIANPPVKVKPPTEWTRDWKGTLLSKRIFITIK